MCARKSGSCSSAFVHFVFSSSSSYGEPPGATSVSTLVGWTLISFLCFAPVQVENFFLRDEIETFFPGFALLAVAAVNLSTLSFRWKALASLTLAFVATYTFANGMLLWALAWPLPTPNEPEPRRRRLVWISIYALAGAISVGAYFVVHRPSYHPEFASTSAGVSILPTTLSFGAGDYFLHRPRLPVSPRDHRIDAVF